MQQRKGRAFIMPKLLPVCSGCGERGIHGSAEECLVQLRRAIAVCKGAAVVAVLVLPQAPIVQRVAEGVSGWVA